MSITGGPERGPVTDVVNNFLELEARAPCREEEKEVRD